MVPNGRFNSGIGLDGSGSYLDPGNLGSQGRGTVEAWVHLTNPSSPFRLFAATYDNRNQPIFLGDTSSGSPIIFSVNSGNFYVVNSGVSASELLGCWHHVAGTWGPRGLEIWIDGRLLSANPSAPPGMPYSISSWRVGCDFGFRCMNGVLDDVRVSTDQRTFTSSALAPVRYPRAAIRSGIRAPSLDGTLTFLPLIEVAPMPSCPFGS